MSTWLQMGVFVVSNFVFIAHNPSVEPGIYFPHGANEQDDHKCPNLKNCFSSINDADFKVILPLRLWFYSDIVFVLKPVPEYLHGFEFQVLSMVLIIQP